MTTDVPTWEEVLGITPAVPVQTTTMLRAIERGAYPSGKITAQSVQNSRNT